MSTSTLKIVRNKSVPLVDPEFQALIAPLTAEERRQLETNLSAEGCRDALVVWNGILLDGHNRLEICTRIRIPYRISELDCPGREAAKLWIEENQIGRRNLTPDQRAAIAYRIMQRRVEISKRERARKGGLSGGSGRTTLSLVAASSTEQKKPRLRERAASELGVSTRKVRVIGEIVKYDPAAVERIVAGTLTIRDAKEEVREKLLAAQRRIAIETNPRGERIHTGDLKLLSRLLPNDSVELFLTDPPFNDAALFAQLAELAQAKLKPGGFCLVYSGTLNLPKILAEMNAHLDYFWMLAVAHDGGRLSRVWPRKVIQHYSPVLMFTKRPAPRQSSHAWFSDLIHGTHDKTYHRWGKSESELEYWIERLTEPGQLVVDPFCGGGSVPSACVKTNRRYVATEIDPGIAAAARARVAKLRKSQSGMTT